MSATDRWAEMDERCADCDGSGEVEIETRPTPRLGCDPPGPSWQVAPCPTCQPREHALWEMGDGEEQD